MEKVALVTGASRGIGRTIAVELAHSGYAVGINYRQNRAAAEELAETMRAEGFCAAALCADVASRAQVDAMVKKLEDTFGAVSALVNNAGIASQGVFQDMSDEEWERMLAVNVGGARNTVLAVLPGMLHEKRGAIVNVASVWGMRGASCEVAYAASKHAMVGLSRSLAMELAPSGIRVNCVAPGVIDTDMVRPLGEETLADLAGQTPLGRLGTPQDVAAAVSFLVSDQASFITGQVLGVDGGF